MKKITRILLLVLVVSLTACDENPIPLEEKYPVQPNDGDFSGCYYFF